MVYFLLPQERRWAFLLAASYFFYGSWDPGFLLLLLASTVVDYMAGLKLHRTESPALRKRWLALSLSANLGILFIFKYFNFFRNSLATVMHWVGVDVTFHSTGWVLPVGISFYTFQTMGYTIDVYRRRMEPLQHFGKFALYVSYFPQLVAGPIERATQLIPQLDQPHTFLESRASRGAALMLWGFFKKVAVADRLALLVDHVYKQPGAASGPDLIVATIAFYFQIYCDFSGYTDIAIGCASIMGVELMDNFNRPYISHSISDFWSRWHISLSSWFRDYVYIPLGGNRVGNFAWMGNVLAVFLLSGLWHGANWTFVIWGLLHSLYYFAERWSKDRITLPEWLARVVTFLAVTLAWVYFRAPSIGDANLIVSKLGTHWEQGFPAIEQLPPRFLTINLALVLLMIRLDGSQGTGAPRGDFQGPRWKRWGIYYLLLFSIILYGNYESHAFIYFQF